MSKIFKLKIQLDGATKPPIWREVLVPSDANLFLLHCTIQGSMGWMNGHLHQFIINGNFYGLPHPEFDDDMEDERKVKISDVLRKSKDKIMYEYDFGDGWLHSVTLIEILEADVKSVYPALLKGKGACPPEDCGGIFGFEDLKEVMKNPKNEEHEDMVEWLGYVFDPDEFELAEHQTATIEAYKSGVKNKGKEFLL